MIPYSVFPTIAITTFILITVVLARDYIYPLMTTMARETLYGSDGMFVDTDGTLVDVYGDSYDHQDTSGNSYGFPVSVKRKIAAGRKRLYSL